MDWAVSGLSPLETAAATSATTASASSPSARASISNSRRRDSSSDSRVQLLQAHAAMSPTPSASERAAGRLFR
jgi:hypothetical protein